MGGRAYPPAALCRAPPSVVARPPDDAAPTSRPSPMSSGSALGGRPSLRLWQSRGGGAGRAGSATMAGLPPGAWPCSLPPSPTLPLRRPPRGSATQAAAGGAEGLQHLQRLLLLQEPLLLSPWPPPTLPMAFRRQPPRRCSCHQQQRPICSFDFKYVLYVSLSSLFMTRVVDCEHGSSFFVVCWGSALRASK